MNASTTLDLHGDLMDRLATNEAFRSVVEAQAGMHSGLSQEEAMKAGHVEGLAERLIVHLRTAESYRVTEDMCWVLQQAAGGLDESDSFDLRDAPTGTGFVSFAHPLPLTDVRGNTLLIHAATWGMVQTQVGPTAAVSLWNDHRREPDDSAVYMRDHAREAWDFLTQTSGRWGLIGTAFARNGQSLGPALIEPTEKQVTDLARQGEIAHSGTNGFRYMQALWLMLGQTITKVTEEPGDRASRRRSLRRGLPGKVTVIQLRRTEDNGRHEGESMVEWAHRWLVRGHWRWQPCGENYPGAVQIDGKWKARIWINGFVKGPDGAPFKQSEKVYELRR